MAFEKDPKNINILIFTALNWQSLNNPKEALKYIEFALKLAPENDFVLFTAGKINYTLKNFEKAQDFLIRSWEANPTVEVENMLGLNYFKLGEYEKANTIFIKLLNKNPMNTNLLLNSAKCYEKLSDVKSAKKQLNKALEIFPEMEDAKKLLSKLKKMQK